MVLESQNDDAVGDLQLLKIDSTPETLCIWLRQYERDVGGGIRFTTSERLRLKES